MQMSPHSWLIGGFLFLRPGRGGMFHNKDHVTEAIMLDLKRRHKWLARDRDNMMVHTGRASCGKGATCVDWAQEAREENR